MRPFRRHKTRPAPDDGRPSWPEQHALLDRIERGEFDNTTAYRLLIGMGPIRGSYGDYTGTHCHHLGPYPGCRGGCNHR